MPGLKTDFIFGPITHSPMPSLRLTSLFMLVAFTCTAQVMNVRKWRQGERDTLENGLALVDESYYAKALPFFEHLLNNHPSESFLKYSYARCALHRGDKQHEAYDMLQEIYSKNKKIPDIQYDLALAAFYRHRFDDASSHLQQYLSTKKISPQGLQNATGLQRYIANAKWHVANPSPSRISVLGDAVNTEYDEYSPAINATGSSLVFAAAGPQCTGGLQHEDLGEDIRSQVYLEDVFIAQKEGKLLTRARPLDSLNTFLADRVVALSPDGRRALLYIDMADGHGDIYESVFNGRYFEAPVRLTGQLNGYSRESHAAYSPDGQTIYFSSDRSGGYGGLDIYRATLVGDTMWTNLVNLGDSVNTSYDEDTPFLAGDGKTLFFSSRGRNSMGGYDVFAATMGPDSTFSGTRNLGYPVNGTWDDLHFVLTADGKTGYMSSERKEGMGMRDIYHVEPSFEVKAAPAYIAKGTVRGPGGALPADIIVDIMGSPSRIYTKTFGDSAGTYLVELTPGNLYRVSAGYEGMLTSSITIDARTLAAYTEKTHDFLLKTVGSPVPEPVLASSSTVSAPGGTVAANSSSSVTASSGQGTATSPGGSSPGAGMAEPSAPVAASVVAWPDKDGFMPQTLLQKKSMRYMQKYGDVKAPDLFFLVQFAAVKGRANMYFPKLSKYGRVERLLLGDGYTRLTVGGKYATLSKAFAMNKKAIRAGQNESFVIAMYKGKRVQFEDLERLGVFK